MFTDPALLGLFALVAVIVIFVARAILRAWRLGDVRDMGVSQAWLSEYKGRELP